MKRFIALSLLAMLVAGCSSVPDKKELIRLVESDKTRVDAKVVSYDRTTRHATVVYHHSIVYGKTSAVKCEYDGSNWKLIEEKTSNVRQER